MRFTERNVRREDKEMLYECERDAIRHSEKWNGKEREEKRLKGW